MENFWDEGHSRKIVVDIPMLRDENTKGTTLIWYQSDFVSRVAYNQRITLVLCTQHDKSTQYAMQLRGMNINESDGLRFLQKNPPW